MYRSKVIEFKSNCPDTQTPDRLLYQASKAVGKDDR